tara:strand:- start:15459 stop:15758 length:300 start_codon:yes stop_codon:yes gene_type:complete
MIPEIIEQERISDSNYTYIKLLVKSSERVIEIKPNLNRTRIEFHYLFSTDSIAESEDVRVVTKVTKVYSWNPNVSFIEDFSFSSVIGDMYCLEFKSINL